MTSEGYDSEEEQSQELLLRTGSNMIEDDGVDEYAVPSRTDGRGYDARCPISGCPVGTGPSSSRTIVPESDPRNYGYDTSLLSDGPSGCVIDNAPVHVSPFGAREDECAPDGDGAVAHVYGAEVDRRVDFHMSEEDIDTFVGKDYPFVLRLSKIGSRVVKNIAFNTHVFMKGRSNSVFREEFELSTDMPGNLFETVKSRINIFLGDVEKGAVAEELHDAKNITLYVKSLKQIDLMDIRSDIDRPPNCQTREAGGTRQELIPLQNSSDLITALNLIAFRDNVREHEQTQSTHLSSFVLDVVVKVRHSRQASARVPVRASQPEISSHFSRSNDDEISTITASTTTSRGGRKRPPSPDDSDVNLQVYLIAPTWKGQAAGGVERPMVYDKTFIGGKLEIPATRCPQGKGVRLGMVKRMVAEKAMLEKEYTDGCGGIVFDAHSELFVSSNKSARYVEKIGSSTKSLWETIKRLRTKRTRLETNVELVLSFGRKQDLLDDSQEFDYSSDYSEKLLSKEMTERSPEKFDDRTRAAKRREGKLAANSHESVAEKFILTLYTHEKSPAYHGFSFEHSVCLRKAFSVLKINGKYIWDVYLCDDKYPDTWPTIKFLTIPAFNVLPLAECDKAIIKGNFTPENGIWPYRQLLPGKSGASAGGPSSIADTLPSLGLSMVESSKIMSDGFVAADALRTPSSRLEQETKNRVVFTRLSKGDDDIVTKFETMSETYSNEDTPMGDIFEKMWQTDTSPVFYLTGEQERGMTERTYEYKMFVSSENCVVEKLYTLQTFEVEKLGNMVNLVGCPLVQVRIECAAKGKSNLVRRQLFSWR